MNESPLTLSSADLLRAFEEHVSRVDLNNEEERAACRDELERRLGLVGWKPIATAPHDGTEVLVGVHVATVWIVRNAWWRTGDENPDFTSEDAGWWAYRSSVTQEQLDGFFAPTHWYEMAPEPEEP